MGKPAARMGDMHVCPMVTPGTPPVPHVGGPIIAASAPTVMICSMPAAVMGDMCMCVGPPDTILMGSTGVFFCGKPAARLGDPTSHGGSIVVGVPTVLIGEMAAPPPPGMLGGIGALLGPMMAGLAAEMKPQNPITAALRAVFNMLAGLKNAAENANPFVHNSLNCCDCAGTPIAGAMKSIGSGMKAGMEALGKLLGPPPSTLGGPAFGPPTSSLSNSVILPPNPGY